MPSAPPPPLNATLEYGGNDTHTLCRDEMYWQTVAR